MARNKTRQELEVENQVLKRFRLAESIVPLGLSIIRWGALIWIAKYAYLTAEAFAGKTTLTDIGIDFLANIKVSVALAWGAGIGGGVYGYHQRKLRKDTVARLQNRIQQFETIIDSKRSTSNLTSRGDTRPEDEA